MDFILNVNSDQADDLRGANHSVSRYDSYALTSRVGTYVCEGVHVCLWVCVNVCLCGGVHVNTGALMAVKSLGAGVTGGCEHPSVDAGN